MKKLITLFAMAIAINSFGQAVTNDFELGNRNLYFPQCWAFGAFSVANNANTLISGSFSARSNQLTSSSTNASWLKSPWIRANAGNISFDTKLDGSAATTRGIVIAYIPFDASNATTGEGAPVDFYTYSFPQVTGAGATTVRNISAAVPAAIIGVPHKIRISFVGSGGTGRAGVDNLSIPGVYDADPTNNCFPLSSVAAVDTDGDGVIDAEDDYPNDANRAYNNFFNGADYASLFFEDLWPAIGDYDFNDLVLDYRVNRITDAAGDVVVAEMELRLRAIGAGFRNGFGFEFTNIAPNKVLSVSGTNISPNSIHNFAANGLEAGTNWLTVIPFDDAFAMLPPSGNGIVGVNTTPGAPARPVTTQIISIVFKNNGVAAPGGVVKLNELSLENFNPFLIKNQNRGVEVHLPGKTPTALANPTYFGQSDDASNPGTNTFYISRDQNLPWALQLPQSIPHMLEKEDIANGYPKLIDFVTSGGMLFGNWYTNAPGFRNGTVLFQE